MSAGEWRSRLGCQFWDEEGKGTYPSAAQEEVPAAAADEVVVDWAATRAAPDAARKRAVSCIVYVLV